MSELSPIQVFVNASFRTAFGTPHNSLNLDDHWRLQSSPEALPIHILVNGTRATPVLWVFDPYDHNIFNKAIDAEADVPPLILEIQRRVDRSTEKTRPAGS